MGTWYYKVVRILLCLSTETLRASAVDYSRPLINLEQRPRPATSPHTLYPWLDRQYWPRSSNTSSIHTPGPLRYVIFAGPLSNKSDLINGFSYTKESCSRFLDQNDRREYNYVFVLISSEFRDSKYPCLQVKIIFNLIFSKSTLT